jgi:hypothetical protein
MDLLDRYLQAVKFFLPRAQQNDIIKELSEDVHSRLDDLQAELGRPPNAAEQERLIKSYGHPALLAGRYGPRRQLVGPEMFPFYWFVLRLALSTAILVHAITAAALFASGTPAVEAAQGLLRLVPVAFIVFGVVTIVFSLLDRYRPRWHALDRWDPHSLPPVVRTPPRRPRSIPQLVIITFFVVWYSFPPLVFGPQSIFALASVWHTLYVPIVLLALVDLVLRWAAYVRPNPTRLRALTRIVVRAASLVVLYVLLQAGDLVVVGEAGRSMARLQPVLTIINNSVYVALIVAGAFSIVGIVLELRGLIRHGGERPPEGLAIGC